MEDADFRSSARHGRRAGGARPATTGPAGAIETTPGHCSGHARAPPDKAPPGRACGAGHGFAQMRRSADIQVGPAVHDAQAGGRRFELARQALRLKAGKLGTGRGKRRQGMFAVFPFSQVQGRPARARNAQADALIGYKGALMPRDRMLEARSGPGSSHLSGPGGD